VLRRRLKLSQADENSITISRAFDVPADELFAVWTDAALLEQWQADHVTFEAFEGGHFRYESADVDTPGHTHVVTGTLIGFEQDRKLVELWHHEGDGEVPDSTLVVTFRPLADERTELTLVEISDAHSDPQSRIFSLEAWDEALSEIAELLE